jgi:ribonuclease P protein component
MANELARLKARADFLRVAAARRSAARPGLVLQAAAAPPGAADATAAAAAAVRVGFTASRKVGNAVARNRAKRRMRAAAAEVLGRSGVPGTDYVLIARGATAARPYAQLVGDLAGALRQIARGDGGRRRHNVRREEVGDDA